MPVIGFLNNQSAAQWKHLLAGFHQGLAEAGFVEDQNVVVEYRWAEGRNERLEALVSDLVSRKVAVIVATGGPDPINAAKSATTVIPIVFTVGTDPVKAGLVQSLARPAGNITGFTLFTTTLAPKRLEILRELVPGPAPIAMLVNPENIGMGNQIRDLSQAAGTLGQRLHVATARGGSGIDAAFADMIAAGVRALFVASDSTFFARRAEIVALAVAHKIPTIYEAREFVEAGGLLSYGVSFPDVYRQAGLYTARILRGAKPADLPVVQPSRFELVLNLKTAKALGLTFPPTLMALANEVIE